MNTRVRNRAIALIAVMIVITTASARLRADTGTCGGASTTLPSQTSQAATFFSAR